MTAEEKIEAMVSDAEDELRKAEDYHKRVVKELEMSKGVLVQRTVDLEAAKSALKIIQEVKDD